MSPMTSAKLPPLQRTAPMNIRLPLFTAFSVILAVASTVAFSSALPASAQTLKGGVQQEGRGEPAPGLNRGDIGPGPGSQDDAFSNQGDGQGGFTPDFGVQQTLPPAPPKGFNLNANQGGDQFNPGMGNPMMDQVPQTAMTRPPMQSQVQHSDPNDPDSSPDMKLLWDMWHKRVATAIYNRYTAMTNAAFLLNKRQPLLCSASYTVTRNGQIINAQLVQRSPNIIYNTIVLSVVQSINGDTALLQFPPGSRRQTVEKSATFEQNYGHEGFRHLTNDQETIRGGMRPPGR